MKSKLIMKCVIFFAIILRIEGVGIFDTIRCALYDGFNELRCSFRECCSLGGKWITADMRALDRSLESQLYGQPLVRNVVSRALRGHLSDDQPKKALVMSFHGWTGGGKNYAAKFIADSIYKLGQKSQYVHLFLSTVHFPHEQESDIYKLHLQDWIRGNVTKCERSLFIFDEIDKMPLGMIDGIKPFIDYHESIDGIDFRKAIFIFLSNTGGPEITRRMLEMWNQGRKREDITMGDLEYLVQHGAFNEKGGLHKSDLIQHSLVDHYVPFLPLERKHVESCIRDEIHRRGHRKNEDFVKKVADKMTYFPQDIKLFSTTGCKRVAHKVAYSLVNEMSDDIFD